MNKNNQAVRIFPVTYSLILTLSILLSSCSSPQEETSADKFLSDLKELSSIENAEIRSVATDSVWNRLKNRNRIPYTSDSTAIFLYRGEAESVSWNGDFNGWSNEPNYKNKGERIPGTDIWYLKKTFPVDARLDYKITLNSKDWILDPENPHQQWSGFGPNSELRMPEWSPEPLTERLDNAPEGTLTEYRIIHSDQLGYDVQYRVYTPAGYNSLANLPVIYITDGHEYADPKLGATTIVLDNLIHRQKIKPVIAVFTDPLNPEDPSENRRTEEFALDSSYLAFYAQELIPIIDQEYKTNAKAESRAILGTSLGGLNATYFGFSRPDLFSMIGIQAPAYWYREDIYDIVRESKADPERIYMSVGTIGDNLNDARQMKRIFEEKDLDFTYTEVNEGHSWGAWSAQMDDILIQLFGN